MGGGVAGSVDFPLYLRTMHGVWLTEANLILQAALAGSSPYAGAFAYNPEPDLDAYLEAWDGFEGAADGYGSAQYDDFVAIAETEVDNNLDPLANITTLVNAFDANQATRRQRAAGRFAAGMADAHAALGAGFLWGMASIEQDQLRESDEYEARLTMERAARRPTLILQATGQVISLADKKLDTMEKLAAMRGDLSRLTIQSQSQRLSLEVEYDVADSQFDLQLFTHPANLLSSISGGIATAPHTPRYQQALSSATGTLSALGPLIAAL